MGLINLGFKLYLQTQMPRINRFISKPLETQERLFSELLQDARFTEIGRKYDFKTIKNAITFAERVPVGDYETHKNDINRMMHGEANVLWHGRTQWFSKSSGTTNDKSKFLPVSNENLQKCHIQGPTDSLALFYDRFPNARIFDGKGLIMGGAYSTFEPYPATKFGDVSSIMIDHIPDIAKKLVYTPSMDIALMPAFDEKIEKMAHYVINDDVTNIGGVPTWTTVLFQRMLEISGKSNILEIWPNLQVYFHGGVSFEPYKEQFKAFLPSEQVKYIEVYNASEGYFAVKSDEKDDMLLLLDNGIYYEFLPVSEWDAENPKAIPLSEVEIGVNYATVISTNSGLWRYMTGDTVAFTSKFPFKIKITGRTKHFINAFGEEVMVANTDAALATTCHDLNALVREYTVAPIYFGNEGSKGGHQWLIEFEKAPLSLAQFEAVLDKNLQKINSDYEAKRFKNMALNPLQIHAVPKDTFYNWLRAKGRYGGQSKVPRLSNDRKILEDILHFSTIF
jgi:hypothetical protein